MSQSNRISGGQIDRSKTFRFTFDGHSYVGHPGDTLASALLANGVRLMGRSFKYHRPRGPLSAGSEEPNALVELRSGARQEPNTRATVVELFDGLQAKSQNAWPSLKFDALSINDRLNSFFTAGFYYKTFMWPAAFWEKVYEPIIRRAAGLGSLSLQDDPDEYDKGFLHCDVLIIGAGPAGLMAALTAGRAGARVILADEDFRMGGRLNAETLTIGNHAGADWAADTVRDLAQMPNVRLMPRTTVLGAMDHGIYSAVERVSDHLPTPAPGKPRQILWRIVMPQVARKMLPEALNQMVSLFKATTIVSLIAVPDLMFVAKQINGATFRSAEAFGAALLVYYLLARVLITPAMRGLERAMARRLGRA